LWLNGVSKSKGQPFDSLYEVVYKESIATEMYDLDLCFEVV